MMIEYYKIKSEYGNPVILFRDGDYYTCFLEDAEVISDLFRLSTILVDNVKQLSFAFSELDKYLPTIVRAGYRVAIADKINDGRGNKLDYEHRDLSFNKEQLVIKQLTIQFD